MLKLTQLHGFNVAAGGPLNLLVDSEIFYAPVITTPAVSDSFWTSVVLLTGFEGANASTTVTDESSKLHGNATVVGSGTIVTAQKKYGGSSFRFNASSALRWADHADWTFGTGNFTVELFFRIDAATGIQQLIGQWGASGAFGWRLWTNNQFLNFNVSTTGSNNVNIMGVGSPTLVANTWYHLCVDYDGIKYRIYVDGVMANSYTTPFTFFDSAATLSLGANSGSSDFLTGYLDEVRITKGIARYANDSGFIVPMVAYPRS